MVEEDGLYFSLTSISFEISHNHLKDGKLGIRCEALFSTIFGIVFEDLITEEKGSVVTLSKTGKDFEVFSEGLVDYDQDINLIKPLEISGNANIYKIGDTISLNCSSSYSYPPAYLEWFINDRQVSTAK